MEGKTGHPGLNAWKHNNNKKLKFVSKKENPFEQTSNLLFIINFIFQRTSSACKYAKGRKR
jgi:hypothetical protein